MGKADVEPIAEEPEGGHGHGHGEHPFEWAGAFELKKGTYKWSFSKKDGAYADPAMKFLILKSSEKEPIESIEAEADTLFKSDAVAKNANDSLVVEKKLYNLEFDQKSDMTFFQVEIPEDGVYVFFTEHFPYEFEDKEHFLKRLDESRCRANCGRARRRTWAWTRSPPSSWWKRPSHLVRSCAL